MAATTVAPINVPTPTTIPLRKLNLIELTRFIVADNSIMFLLSSWSGRSGSFILVPSVAFWLGNQAYRKEVVA